MITDKLHEMTKGCKKKILEWDCDDAFIATKQALREMRELKLANYVKMFMLKMDASNTGLGAVLLQEDEEGKRWIRYSGHQISWH